MGNYEYEKIVNKYSNNIYKMIFCMIQNKDTTGTIIHSVFTKLYISNKEFNDDKSLRRWLIQTAIDESKSMWDVSIFPQYRIVFHLFYYENYSIKEIASILHVLEVVVKKRLSKAKKILKIESDSDYMERRYINE